MDFTSESDPQPATSSKSTACSLYDCLPPELVTTIGDYLPFEDCLHFQECSNYVRLALCSKWHHYDKIQISDDAVDCCIISTAERAPRRRFLERNLNAVFSRCDRIQEVVMIVKDIGSLWRFNTESPGQLKDISLYQANGYLGYLFARMPPQMVSQLKTVSLHVDIMRENLRQLCFPCPTQDLLYSIHHLADLHFDTFVQISFCSTTIHPEDYQLRNMLMRGMEMTLKDVAKYSAKTDFTVDAAEGYVDMTVEKGNVEYSFAFFYYNPHICEPEPEPELESSDLANKFDGELKKSFLADNNLTTISSGSNNSACSNNRINSNTFICTNALNEVHCQANFQNTDPRLTSFWRSLTQTHS